jgi:lipoprotein-anchoring transpeptidase ErfK/SrfK
VVDVVGMRTPRPTALRLAVSIFLPVALAAAVVFAVTAQASTAPVRPVDSEPVADTRLEPVAPASAPTDPDPQPATTPAPVDPRVIVTPPAGAGLAVYPAAGATAPSQLLPAYNELGSPLVLLGLRQYGDWIEVLVPTRPNDDTGWVRAQDVTTSTPMYRVEVSLVAHDLKVIRMSDDAVVLTAPVGIGRPDTPTPTGHFFVRDHFPTGSWSHPYGPFAFGLSGHSEVLYQFGTGDGRLAIHGTNQPSTIGADLSNGCPRVANDVVMALIDYLPLGTPVVIS